MDVELSYFVSGAISGVRDIDPHFGIAARRNRLGFKANIVESELGIAQAEAEWKQGLAPGEEIAAVARASPAVPRESPAAL